MFCVTASKYEVLITLDDMFHTSENEFLCSVVTDAVRIWFIEVNNINLFNNLFFLKVSLEIGKHFPGVCKDYSFKNMPSHKNVYVEVVNITFSDGIAGRTQNISNALITLLPANICKLAIFVVLLL